MKLFLAKPRGFCAGVTRAIDTVKKALEHWGAPIYVKHEIVHNSHVIEELREKGAIFIEDLYQVPEGSRIVYSAHGIPPLIREEARKRNLIEIDATCGLVTKVHSAIKRYTERGYQIVLIGHRNHVEMIGTVGVAPQRTVVVENAEEAEKLTFSKGEKIAYFTQTTLSLDDVEQIVDVLKKKFPSIQTLPTSSICYATTNRQMALRHIAHEVDLILVVGDRKSSNSNRLKEVAEYRGKQAYLINSEEEISLAWLSEVRFIGMTAGASTPEMVVQRCVKKLQRLGVQEIEEVAYTEEEVFFQLPRTVLYP